MKKHNFSKTFDILKGLLVIICLIALIAMFMSLLNYMSRLQNTNVKKTVQPIDTVVKNTEAVGDRAGDERTIEVGEVDWNNVVTVDDRSFVPLWIDGYPHDHAQVILAILQKFEAKHPEWEIEHWEIEKQPKAIFGLWIDHKSRGE